MKQYPEIYEVLEAHRGEDSRFGYIDRSRCRGPSHRCGRILGPLWIRAEDPTAGRRFWVIQKKKGIEVSIEHFEPGRSQGEIDFCKVCQSPREAADLLRELFQRKELFQ